MIFADSSLPKPHVSPVIHTITTAATGASHVEGALVILFVLVVVGLLALALYRRSL